MNLHARCLAVLCALGWGTSSALAADFDCPRVTVIVPYPAGGAADVAARLVADRLEAGLKKSFVIENRPGATGNIGTAAVVNAKPDGCTLLVNAAVLATFPSSFSKLGFDPVKDLAPIGGIGVTPTLLVAPKSLPADDLKSLVQLSRQRPDGLSFSTAGYGLLQHLAVEEMAQRTGGKFVHVVYKGGAQAATDLIAARVDFGSFAAGSVIQFVKGGELKPLAVVQPTRSDLMPEVATIAEQGLPGLDAGGRHFPPQRRTQQDRRGSGPEGAFCQYRLRPDGAHPRRRGGDHAQDRRGLGARDQAPEYQAGLTAAGIAQAILASADSCLYKPLISHADLGLTAVRWLILTARPEGAHGSAAAQPENTYVAS